jgi:hypothetical protein
MLRAAIARELIGAFVIDATDRKPPPPGHMSLPARRGRAESRCRKTVVSLSQ